MRRRPAAFRSPRKVGRNEALGVEQDVTTLGRRLVALVTPLVAATAGCASAPAAQEIPMTYRDVSRALEARGVQLAPGSDAERRALERFQQALADFKSPDFRARLRDAYAEGVWFNDTLKTLTGRDAVESYLAASSDALRAGTVEFLGWTADGRGNYFLRWEMRLRFKRLAGGDEQVSIGMSHVRFDADGRVVLHQDFWDSAAGLWEHLPGLGGVLRFAKRRL
jgi:limonene-1,2-epoxide hydrolase